MSDVNEAWRKAQRARWLRPNGHLYVRADAWRLAPPGTPEAKPPGWLDPSMTRVRWREAQEAEARRQEEEAQERLQRELLDLRRDWEELKREIRAQQLDQKWDGQPRDDRGRFSFGKKPKPESELVSRDAAMRPRGPRPPATPAQQARLAIAHARAEEAVARVRQLDPDWPPPRSLTSADNGDDAEVMIRAKEAETREAEARFMALSRARQDGPYTSPEPQSLREILAPQGDLVGYRYPGAGPDARTVTPAEFENIRTNLMVGARQVEPDARYEGVWYKREDGAIFGLRLSADHGLTLDIVHSNHPLIRDGLRIHQR